jgi:nucleoside-diphosphate-sugar epimerase
MTGRGHIPVHSVAMTGPTGIIGTAIRERLASRYDLRLITRRQVEFPSVIADITDLGSLVTAMQGTQAVVHLAAAATVEATWPEVLAVNIEGTFNVVEAARLAGLDCVVFASSNHVIGMYEVENAPELYELECPLSWDVNTAVRPDSLYGASKVFGEALGRYYADQFGMRVICIRIGSVLASDDPRSDKVAAGPSWMKLSPRESLARMRATWMSQRDCAELVIRALDAVHLDWAVVYGVSDNLRRFWDIDAARELLGFEPHDAAPV